MTRRRTLRASVLCERVQLARHSDDRGRAVHTSSDATRHRREQPYAYTKAVPSKVRLPGNLMAILLRFAA